MEEKKAYWTKREDDLMLILFNTGTTRKEYNHAFEEVLPRLKHMTKNILHRYFHVPEHRVNDLVTDAISHMLVNADFDTTRKTKPYSYCGTLIKRFFYDEIVVPLKYTTKINALNMADDNYDCTTDEWLLDDHATPADFDEFDMDERQEKLNAVLSYFNEAISKVDAAHKLALKNKREPVKTLEMLDRERKYLMKVKDYFNTYFLTTTVDSISLAEYLINNLDIPEFAIMGLSRKYLGVGSGITRIDTREVLMDTRFLRYGLCFEMDDYVPNEYLYGRSKRTARKDKRNHPRYY